MPQIIAWQCAKTKQIFAEKADYEAHMAKLRSRAAAERARVKKRNEIEAAMLPLYQCPTVPEIEAWLMNNQEAVWAHACLHDSFHKKTGVLTSLKLTEIGYSDKTSISHSAPRGMRTNWCGTDKDRPSSVPGWRGRVTYTIDTKEWFDLVQPLKGSGINTGTGGGGSKEWSYDCNLYAQDWPGMARFENRPALAMEKKPGHSVRLTPSHFTRWAFNRREGHEWRAVTNDVVIHSEVYWWLRKNVGREINEYRDADRIHYLSDPLPQLGPEFYSEPHYAPFPEDFRCYHVDDRSIYFEDINDAIRFEVHYRQLFHNWHLIRSAYGAQSKAIVALGADEFFCDQVRGLKTDIFGWVERDGNFHLVHDDHERVMLGIQYPEAKVVTAKALA